MLRTLVAGIAGGMAINIVMLLTFRTIGFGWDGKGILITSPIQSPKLIAVWTQLEPLPIVVTNPLPIIIGMILLGVGHAYIYRSVAAAWPAGIGPRGLRFSGMIFFMIFLFWEFFTPFNQFGEPVQLIAIELCFWGLIALAEGFTIAAIIEKWKEKRA